ncbi:MAG: hypothetical protein CMJ89_02050 [Planctomycetes bacterium]|jgi:hypothetical protein|nr:hypothetical protein [Planctomycetota bacterium]
MTNAGNIRREIESLVVEARRLMPKDLLDLLPPDESLEGVPAWSEFEGQIWSIGEEIRQLFLKAPRLRDDEVLQGRLVEIACDRRAHRGRQSFVALLGDRSCVRHAGRLVEHLDDPCVDGQVISTLFKMRAPGHSDAIDPLLDDMMVWVRNEAKRYLAWEAASDEPV